MTVSDIAIASRWRMPGGLPGTLLRYGASAAGPVAVSAAHFLASLIFLRQLPAREFGLFSFVMVVVSFGMSLNVALISVPLSRNLAIGDAGCQASVEASCFQMNWLVCAGFAAVLFPILLLGGAPLQEAALLALFAGVFTFRWFARCLVYVDGRMGTAIQSDLTYSLVLTGSLAMLAAFHGVSFALGGQLLLVSALAALLPFGASFFRHQITALRGDLRRYRPIFRDVTRWSLMGVALTEVTVNAHAYLVTFISGPGAFALLALGMLLMRPASLLQSALPDLERPAMARAIAAKDMMALSRIQRHFTYGLAAAWVANMLLCAALLAFFPLLVLKKGYNLPDLILVAVISAFIMAIRALRTPLAVLLQAAGQFKELAGIGAASGAVSLAATLILLLAFGPIASMGGVVLGELVVVARCYAVARAWKTAHAGAAHG
jgi:O-antigen/teichoic acid export membrane protein